MDCTFSIVIPTYKRIQLLDNCLAALQAINQNFEHAAYEIIVTDDAGGSSKKALETKFPAVKWTFGPGKGPAANRNNGAKHAQGTWLIFLDDDIIADSNLLNAYQEAVNTYPEATAFEGCILPDDWELFQQDMAECPVNDKGNCFWTANVMVQKELFFKVDGFDEDLLIAAQEDQLLYEALKKETIIPFIKNASVIHPVRIVSIKNKLKNNRISVSNWLIYQKKINQTFLQSFSQGYMSQLRDLVRNLKKRKYKRALLNLDTIFISLPICLINYNERK